MPTTDATARATSATSEPTMAADPFAVIQAVELAARGTRLTATEVLPHVRQLAGQFPEPGRSRVETALTCLQTAAQMAAAWATEAIAQARRQLAGAACWYCGHGAEHGELVEPTYPLRPADTVEGAAVRVHVGCEQDTLLSAGELDWCRVCGEVLAVDQLDGHQTREHPDDVVDRGAFLGWAAATPQQVDASARLRELTAMGGAQ